MAYYSCQVISDPKTSPATVPIISTLPNLLYTVCRSGVGLIVHLDLGRHFVNDQNLSFAATTAQSVPCLCFLPRATSLAINRAICFTHLGGVSNDTSLTSILSHSNHLLGCGSFVRGRKRKKGDSRPLYINKERLHEEVTR